MALVGLMLGVVVLVPLLRVISRMLQDFGLPAAHPSLPVGAAILLFAVSLVASLVPARRASTVDPATVMRAD